MKEVLRTLEATDGEFLEGGQSVGRNRHLRRFRELTIDDCSEIFHVLYIIACRLANHSNSTCYFLPKAGQDARMHSEHVNSKCQCASSLANTSGLSTLKERMTMMSYRVTS